MIRSKSQLLTFLLCLTATCCWAESERLLSPHSCALVTTSIPRTVHLDVEWIDEEVTYVISWKDDLCIWPQQGLLRLSSGNFDLWNGHTIYRPWSYYRVGEETVLKRATHVRVEAGNATTEWMEVAQ